MKECLECKHVWSHKGLEWFERINLKTKKISGKYACLKCGITSVRPLKISLKDLKKDGLD